VLGGVCDGCVICTCAMRALSNNVNSNSNMRPGCDQNDFFQDKSRFIEGAKKCQVLFGFLLLRLIS
jgi:hypothetical protein